MPEGQDSQKPERPDDNKGNGPNLKMSRGLFSWLIFIGLALMLLVMLNGPGRSAKRISIDEFYTHLDNHEIKEVVLRQPPGKRAYEMIVKLGGRELYIKLELGSGKIFGRSFHWSKKSAGGHSNGS